jgi:hypothetical protein
LYNGRQKRRNVVGDLIMAYQTPYTCSMVKKERRQSKGIKASYIVAKVMHGIENIPGLREKRRRGR